MATQVVCPIGGNKLGDNSHIGGMKPAGGITPIPGAEHNNICGMKAAGGITQIAGAEHNPHIIDLACWAVNEYNKEHKTSLKFVKVDDSAEQPVVIGTMYYITLKARDGCRIKEYLAKVWEQAWLDFRKLVEFKQIPPCA